MKEVIRESTILISVPDAEPYVKKWREKYDLVSLHGIPSHITVLYPFKKPELIDERAIDKIKSFFSNIKRFEFSLERIGAWPDVIYLEPEPRDKFIELTEGIVKIFPENLPFNGKFKKINPHLTIGNKLQDLELAKIEISQNITSKLPIKTLTTEAWLMESKNGEWSIREKFPFAL